MVRPEPATRVATYKLFAPPELPGAVPRSAVLNRIFTTNRPRAVVIQGPAGHGKSTLLQQVKSTIDATGALTAWFNLDESDNDVSRFFTGMQVLLANLARAAGEPAAMKRPRDRSLPADWFIERLLELDSPVALIFDEFQTLANRATVSFFRNLVEHLPLPLSVFISSRTVPDIGLARLVVNNQALLLRAEDLRFSRDEVAAFFSRVDELEISSEELGAIHGKTEGWPAAVQLYRLSLARPAVRQSLGDLASFRPRQLAEYLADNVLSLQPPEVQSFLLRTSPLLRMSGELCDAVLGRQNSQEMLEALEQSGFFVRSLDAGMQWFSYHTLFSSFLVEQLRDQGPEAVAQAHQCAASWFGEHGYFEEAIHHALATRDFRPAAEFLDEWATQLVMDGNLATVERWYDRLPLDEVARHPELVIKVAWALAFLRRRQKLAPILELLERQRARSTQPGEAREDVVRSMVAIIDDDIPTAFKIVHPVNARDTNATGFRAFELGAAANLKGYLEITSGDFERARDYLLLARAHGDRANAGFSWGYSIGTAGMNLLCQGKLQEALELIRDGVSQPRVMLDDSVASASLAACYIPLLYEINDLEGARTQFARFHDAIANAAMHDYLGIAYLSMARLHDAEGQPARAQLILEEAESISHMSRCPRLSRLIAWERVRRALVNGEGDQAQSIASRIPQIERPLPEGWVPFSECTEGDAINRIRLAIHEDTPDCALKMIAEELAVAIRQSRIRRQIKLRILEAMAYRVKGIEGAAGSSLRTALQLAAPGGFVRIFLDEGPIASELLRAERRRIHAARTPDSGAASQLVEVLVQASADDFQKALVLPGEEFQPLEPLSVREETILRFLAQGLSNRHIAACVHVSENTVKFHLKNIYSKLGVSSRLQATGAAREMRLV
jgi:LuxR family transcriptional regulator, maltose regulon positive regulatory protein